MAIKVERVYEPRPGQDGYRVLVDRLWPRGLSKDAAGIDLWMRDVAPSTELRKRFGHKVDRWPEFRERYEQELASHGELLDLLVDIDHHRAGVILLFGAHDRVHNEAQVLADVLRRRPPQSHQ